MKLLIVLLVAAALVAGVFVAMLPLDKFGNDSSRVEREELLRLCAENKASSEMSIAKRDEEGKLLAQTNEQIVVVSGMLSRAKESLVSNKGVVSRLASSLRLIVANFSGWVARSIARAS